MAGAVKVIFNSHGLTNSQWQKFPEKTSWMDVITSAQDGYFEGSRTNVYGERWEGPRILEYDRANWPGF